MGDSDLQTLTDTSTSAVSDSVCDADSRAISIVDPSLKLALTHSSVCVCVCVVLFLNQDCQVCHRDTDASRTLLCDLCGHGWHTYCLRPLVSELPPKDEEWHCHECSNRPLRYWTCWIPLGDLTPVDGRLALIPGSHQIGGYETPVVKDMLPGGYSKEVANKAIWHIPNHINMGDIILFNIKTIHAATRNEAHTFRLR